MAHDFRHRPGPDLVREPAGIEPGRWDLARAPTWARLAVALGLLDALSMLVAGPIGVAGTYARLVGAAAQRVAPGFYANNTYLQWMGTAWVPDTFLVLGLAIGGLLASRLGAARGRPHAPAREAVYARQGTAARRYVAAFAGGFLILFGARLAGGCTSGHILSGIMQLSVAGLLFGVAVFASAMLTARLLARGER